MSFSKSFRTFGIFCNLERHQLKNNVHKLLQYHQKTKIAFQEWNYRREMSTISIKTVTIIGAGTMGSGIAQTIAGYNYRVNVVDSNESGLDRCKRNITLNVDQISKKLHKNDAKKGSDYKTAILERLNFSKDLSCVKESQLVIEAIAENLDVKILLFRELEKLTTPSTILTSNTSSISVGDIANALSRKKNMAGLHFFNPVPKMKLIEVIRSPFTSQATYDLLMTWTKSIGKTAVTCRDTSGFIVNRLLMPFVAQALLMMERGDATKEDIDTAVRLGCNFPMGPFELMDFIGLDIVASISVEFERKHPEDPSLIVPKTLLRMVAANKLGRKTGEGFYKYEKK